MPASDIACHNCRRQRLKCDRTLPKCSKCSKRGQQCLGYERLLRWDQGIASRGKMIGMTYEKLVNGSKHHLSELPFSNSVSSSSKQTSRSSSIVAMTDPLLQDLDQVSRNYLDYFARHVCKNLVLYDLPKHNPFRELIAMTHQHPMLLQVIIANSALHMSNAGQGRLDSTIETMTLDLPKGSSGSQRHKSNTASNGQCYRDALTAKQRSLSSLRSAISNLQATNIDVVLATVILLVEAELLHSGQENWRHHINGAKTLITQLYGPDISTQSSVSPLRSFLISNCLIFDIVGSTLACSSGYVPSDAFSDGASSLLQDSEGNHCSSFPTALLEILHTGTRLLHPGDDSVEVISAMGSRHDQALRLLDAAQAFDPLSWANELQTRSPASDVEDRTRVATAHRAAVCIYLSRIIFSLDETIVIPRSFELLVAEVVTILSFVRQSNELFTATTWPAFIAGAETDDPLMQAWVANRFQEIWQIQPWGVIRGALELLEKIWHERKSREALQDDKDKIVKVRKQSNWVTDLRQTGPEWLIM